ncbi:yacO [Symbiodinium necroappetens]|uniref:YacO protein n=1 Tax=Symbiodinium necroappetens TaxID=1628268 RepID=A0A812TJR4_9DINO|nr:yacO [Symbiodinium necroappetens]
MPSSGLNSEPLFFWYDYFSCPQLEKSESFHKAVDSIPAYVARCAFFFVLAPVIENTDLGAVFTEVSWAQRGWCLVERLCRELSEEAPLIVIKSQTQITVVSSVMHYGSMARSPGECDFTLESDKIKLGPVLQKALHGKLLMLLRARDLGGYRVLLNLQPVLLRGFKVLPKYCLFQDEGAEPSSLDPASHAVAEFLFQNGFETISDIDGSGWSPLHYAALRGEPLLIQGLLEQRADPSCKTRKANPNHGTTVAGVEALDLCLAHRNNEAGYLILGFFFQVLTMVALRFARRRGLRKAEMVLYLNGILFKEERAACSVICAWAVNFSWWSPPQETRILLARPCVCILLLLFCNALKKILEFSFLRSKLALNFESDVLVNAFELAALERVADFACLEEQPKELTQTLQQTPVLPLLQDPHAFEKLTAEHLRKAYGKGQKVTVSRLQSTSNVLRTQAPAAWLVKVSRAPELFRALQNSSTTMFFMRMEGKFADIEESARRVFAKLALASAH